MSKFCPHCNEEIDHLKYTADYTEWGSEFGTCALDGSDWEQDDRDSSDSENDNTEYQCPECEHDIDPDELLDELNDCDDDEEDENDIQNNEENENERVIVTDEEISNFTDGGSQVINRSASNTEGPMTDYRISKTTRCQDCSAVNFTENDSVIICIKCNHEILIN